MTNQTTHSPHHQIFQELLHQHGITQMHGVELVRLIHKIANTYESITSERMRDDSLSEPRWRLLVRLWIAERMGAPCVRPTQLSKTQQVSKNTISAHLRSLEEQGLIERDLDPDDRRQFRIRLSGAGRALVEAATPGHVRFLNQLTAGLTATEVEELQRLLERLHQSLITYGQVEPPCHYPE
ncbi:MAG: MarR family transcriptional regulator [Caldilineaceae bacterium]|nr:MarR family transcriptional regulator [Caldilineaceae bacterium]